MMASIHMKKPGSAVSGVERAKRSTELAPERCSPRAERSCWIFLPTRKAAQARYQVQSLTELAHQNNWQQVGLSTDVIKALHHIRRQPVSSVAARLGVPSQLLHSWGLFLGQMSRRFMVMNQLGPKHYSNVGFAEGCPLSILAMVTLDLNMHIYMRHFCPQIRVMSFVDNIILQSVTAYILAMAFTTLQTFLSLWGMQLDCNKSYCWGTTLAAAQTAHNFGN